jgi:hypothetical protein
MLPTESIRFFFLDPNWLDGLHDGALSLAQVSAPDAAMLDLSRPLLREQAHRAALAERQRRQQVRRRTSSPADANDAAAAAQADATAGSTSGNGNGNDDPPPPWTGFLMRSAAVADWPGLTVAAYSDTARLHPLKQLRLDRLAPTVLLAIFDGVAQEIDIRKPAEAMHFGVEEDLAAGHFRVFLRGIGDTTGNGHPVGQQLAGDPAVNVPLRADPKGRRVLDIAGLQSALAGGLAAAYSPETPPPLNPAAFGIQMVAGTERQGFVTGAPAAPQSPPAESAAAQSDSDTSDGASVARLLDGLFDGA